MGAASTTTGRVGTARRLGPGKRDGEVYECRNQWWNPLKRYAGSNLVDVGRYCSASVASWCEGTDSSADGGKVGLEVTVNVCGVTVAWAARGKAGRLSRRSVHGERGNRRRAAFVSVIPAGNGKARRLLMARRRDGVLVVVRAWESHVHGEGGQRVRSGGTGMSGGRR